MVIALVVEEDGTLDLWDELDDEEFETEEETEYNEEYFLMEEVRAIETNAEAELRRRPHGYLPTD